MSHIVTIQAQIRDATALSAACRRLSLAEPIHETVELFSGQAVGHCVRLFGWRYPVVCDLPTGQLHFDSYGGRWGDQRELDRLVQMYAVEKARLVARRAGHSVSETNLPDGSIRLTIHTGGAV